MEKRTHKKNATASRKPGGRGKGGAAPRGRNQAGRARPTSSGRSRSRKKKGSEGGKAVLVLLIFCVIGISALYGAKTYPTWSTLIKSAMEAESKAPEEPKAKAVVAAGVNLEGMTKEEAKQALMKKYPWSLEVAFGQDTYPLPNLLEARIDSMLDQAYGKEAKEAYDLDTSGMEPAVEAQVKKIAAKWDRPAQDATLSGYDKETDTFLFQGGVAGVAIDQAQLAKDIVKAIKAKDFGAVVKAASQEVPPGQTSQAASQKYKTLAVYTTKTTANKDRNNNIKLACQALNGTMLQPGEEFSFNKAVGERTPQKGYKAAAAYSNGEVVQEIGGGVCQLSTTLYNSTIGAGLDITKRQSHTFQPSYITPGQDATVSWGQPDFHFVNNTGHAIGIRANYENRKVTVSIYGIPVLGDGVEQSLKSRKVATLGVPAPVYVEDPTLQPGQEVVKKAGTAGSKWETLLVTTKDGKVISQKVDHTATYKGHAPVIARNTLAAPVAESTAAPAVAPSSAATQPATEKGPVPGEVPGSGGPGSSGAGGPGVPGSGAPGNGIVPNGGSPNGIVPGNSGFPSSGGAPGGGVPGGAGAPGGGAPSGGVPGGGGAPGGGAPHGGVPGGAGAPGGGAPSGGVPGGAGVPGGGAPGGGAPGSGGPIPGSDGNIPLVPSGLGH